MTEAGPRDSDDIERLVPLLESIFAAAAHFGSLPEQEQESILRLDDEALVSRTVGIFRSRVAQGRRLHELKATAAAIGLTAETADDASGDWGAGATADLLCRLVAAHVTTVRRDGAAPDWAGAFATALERLASDAEPGRDVSIELAVPNASAPEPLDEVLARHLSEPVSAGVIVVPVAVSGEAGRLLVFSDGRSLPIYSATAVDSACATAGVTRGEPPQAAVAGGDWVLDLLLTGGS